MLPGSSIATLPACEVAPPAPSVSARTATTRATGNRRDMACPPLELSDPTGPAEQGLRSKAYGARHIPSRTTGNQHDAVGQRSGRARTVSNRLRRAELWGRELASRRRAGATREEELG